MTDRLKRALFIVLLVLTPALACAQSAPDRPKKHSIPGTPLDTLMSTHLTTVVPPAQDFVRDSRPDSRTLDYTPLTGHDPDDRPKPRDKANVAALQAELEQSGAKNAARGGALRPSRHGRKVKAAE